MERSTLPFPASNERRPPFRILLCALCIVHPALCIAEPTDDSKSCEPADMAERTISITLPGDVILEMMRIPGTNCCMGKYEVTQAQWEAVTGKNPAKYKKPSNPVEHVNCEDCEKFCEQLNALPAAAAAGLTFRLPKSGEWEFACRGGSKKRFTRLADGREIVRDTLGEVAWYGDTSGGKPHEVGQLKPNAFGLYDVLGNLWEWTSTTNEVKRINRGGSLDDNGWVCQAHFKNKLPPHLRRVNNGFRLCATLPDVPADHP